MQHGLRKKQIDWKWLKKRFFRGLEDLIVRKMGKSLGLSCLCPESACFWHAVTWELEGCCCVAKGCVSLAFLRMLVGGQTTFSAWGAVWEAEALLCLYAWETSCWITEFLRYWTFGKSGASEVTGTLLWSIWEAQLVPFFMVLLAVTHCTMFLLLAGRIKTFYWAKSLICMNTSPLGDHKRHKLKL